MYYDYIILGAGPAGLQLGYFLHKENKKYVILEKDKVCSFFKRLPRHRKLISFNKPYIVDCDYNKLINIPDININKNEVHMRYDWNSLLSDNEELVFRKYTEDFFPNADIMVNYMNDFSKINNLNVVEGINIININKKKDIFYLRYSNNNNDVDNINDCYTCKHLIICTGLSKPNIPKEISGIEHAIGYEELELNDELYKGKKICILGAGNSAMETANYLLNKGTYICMKSRSKRKIANSTHYVGDVRATHSNFFDVFQFKTLGVFEPFKNKFRICKKDELFLVNNEEYDVVIRCLGFKFDDSIFDQSIKPQLYKNKVPLITDNFQSLNVENLYFGGSITQYLGYRKGTYGFIHGFRYVMKYISNILLDNKEQITYDLTDDNLIRIIFKVINENSCIFQLFENFCYVLLFDYENKQIIDIGEMPVSKAIKITDYDKILITFEYNLEKRDDEFDSFITSVEDVGFISRFFHPVLRYISKECDLNDFKEFNDLKYKYNTRVQCMCGNFEDFNYMNKHTICKDCSNEAVCYYCCGKEQISNFEDNKCRKCRGNNIDNVYKKIYNNRQTNCIYRFDFMEETDSIYCYVYFEKSITRYLSFLATNSCFNIERNYLPNHIRFKNDYDKLDKNKEMTNMISIKGQHPLLKDIVKRPFQRNYLFKRCYIYPKTDKFPLEVYVQDNKDLEYIENDERRLEGLNSLINKIENIK